MSIRSYYQQLFGGKAPTDGSLIDMAEHGRVGGVSTGQGFKFVSTIDGATPTEGNNPEFEYDLTDPNSIVITQTIGATEYQQTITISGDKITEGEWSQV